MLSGLKSPLDGFRSPLGALSGAGFDPSSLFASSEDGAFYDVSDLTSLKQERTGASATTASVVDGIVGTILDRSGNGNHAVAPSDAARPILRQSGSLYYLEFDGVDDYLRSTVSGFEQPFTWAPGLTRHNSAGGNQTVGGVTGNVALYAPDVELMSQFAGSTSSSHSVPDDAPAVILGYFDGASSYVRVDGTDSATTNPGTDDPGGWTIGASKFGSGVEQLDLFGFLAIDRELTSDEKTSFDTWMAAKSGVTL